MRTIYFIHGYGSSAEGNKYSNISKFYLEQEGYNTQCWEWNEAMDIDAFIKEKILFLSQEKGEHILMADSMGGNIAFMILKHLPNLNTVMINPVFSPKQIYPQGFISEVSLDRVADFTSGTLPKNNLRLVISEKDDILEAQYFEKVSKSKDVLLVPEDHTILNIYEYMPKIHRLIEDSFSL